MIQVSVALLTRAHCHAPSRPHLFAMWTMSTTYLCCALSALSGVGSRPPPSSISVPMLTQQTYSEVLSSLMAIGVPAQRAEFDVRAASVIHMLVSIDESSDFTEALLSHHTVSWTFKLMQRVVARFENPVISNDALSSAYAANAYGAWHDASLDSNSTPAFDALVALLDLVTLIFKRARTMRSALAALDMLNAEGVYVIERCLRAAPAEVKFRTLGECFFFSCLLLFWSHSRVQPHFAEPIAICLEHWVATFDFSQVEDINSNASLTREQLRNVGSRALGRPDSKRSAVTQMWRGLWENLPVARRDSLRQLQSVCAALGCADEDFPGLSCPRCGTWWYCSHACQSRYVKPSFDSIANALRAHSIQISSSCSGTGPFISTAVLLNNGHISVPISSLLAFYLACYTVATFPFFLTCNICTMSPKACRTASCPCISPGCEDFLIGILM